MTLHAHDPSRSTSFYSDADEPEVWSTPLLYTWMYFPVQPDEKIDEIWATKFLLEEYNLQNIIVCSPSL